jgi:hypothetical protein
MLKMSCNLLKCNGNAKITCSGCKMVKYCSESCQEKELIIHNRICYARPEDRIRGYIKLIKETDEHERCSGEHLVVPVNLSFRTYIKFTDGKFYRVSALGADGLRGICAVCYKKVDYSGPMMHRTKHITKNVGYYLCNHCHETGAELFKVIKLLVFYKEHFIMLLNADIWSALVKIAFYV